MNGLLLSSGLKVLLSIDHQTIIFVFSNFVAHMIQLYHADIFGSTVMCEGFSS